MYTAQKKGNQKGTGTPAAHTGPQNNSSGKGRHAHVQEGAPAAQYNFIQPKYQSNRKRQSQPAVGLRRPGGLQRRPQNSHAAQVQHRVGQPRVQRGFWGSLWKGIKKVGKGIWSGVKWLGKGLWKGLKFLGKGLWTVLKFLGKASWTFLKFLAKYSWNVTKSAVALVTSLFTEAPKRIWELLKHVLWNAPVGIFKWLWNGITTVRSLSTLGTWIWNGFKGSLKWTGMLIHRLFDVSMAPEALDLAMQIIKPNTRSLTSAEIAEAQKVYGNSIQYWKVRIDNFSLLAKLFSGPNADLAFVTFHTINMSADIKGATAGSSAMAWLIHELCHVRQMESMGTQYISKAIHAQATTGYAYGGLAALQVPGRTLSYFNYEQQGDIARDYYYEVTGANRANVVAIYQPYISAMKQGKFG